MNGFALIEINLPQKEKRGKKSTFKARCFPLLSAISQTVGPIEEKKPNFLILV
jgi:hypothetical protein